MQDHYDELVEVEARLKKLEQKIRQVCQQNETCRRILKIPGVGDLPATAIVAAVPNAGEFKNGRHMSAWLGLPRDHLVVAHKSRWGGIGIYAPCSYIARDRN